MAYTIEEFVDMEKQNLDDFLEFYKKQQELDQDNWPESMGYGDWQEQFLLVEEKEV